MKRKIKVVLLCHFSNSEVRKYLSVSHSKFDTFIRKIMNKGLPCVKNDFAPWISDSIKAFETMDDVELHIIAPCPNMDQKRCEFNIRSVDYHFFRGNLHFPIEQLVKYICGAKRQYRHNTKLVKQFIDQINPDIVNLVGTENPYYSATILAIKDRPVLVTAQTVYTNPARMKFGDSIDMLRWQTELKIHAKERYFGCTGRMHRDLILQNNPDAMVLKMMFPREINFDFKPTKKIYDFVFFAAGIEQKKGIEEAIASLYIVKKEKQDVTLNIIGDCIPTYKAYLDTMIDRLALVQNVFFDSYFPQISDMYQQVRKSKYALLPIKLDVISGTVIEAMFMELPVVTCKTTGTPYLNREKECVLLSDIGDVDSLAENMLKLINSNELCQTLRVNAKECAASAFGSKNAIELLLADYYAVIDNYKNKTPIPKELIFDPVEFPIY